jgi:nucleotidyltransferase/DNA polymerase involved in DNA repair
VRAELGLPISVGVARTKHLAKIASQVATPDGCRISRLGTRRFPEFGTTLHGTPAEP